MTIALVAQRGTIDRRATPLANIAKDKGDILSTSRTKPFLSSVAINALGRVKQIKKCLARFLKQAT
jgi:hypothetical protein